jgi:signal transduction histidine kinase
MKRLLSGGATQHIAAIVIASLLAAHMLSAVVWLSFDMRPGPPPEFVRPASQIGLVLRLLDALPEEDHAAILATAVRSGLSIREGTGPLPAPLLDSDPRVHGLSHALRDERGLEHKIVALGREDLPSGPSNVFTVIANPAPLRDRWLLFEFAISSHSPLPWISPSGAASFIAIPLLVALISLWAARRVTSPLVRLAAATESLTILQDPPPVAEEGALEVRQVARALNLMTGKLRRFVSDRTRMLAAISHDLRTPLTRLRLRAETLDDVETSSKMLNDIRTMESMITSTLAFIRDEASQEALKKIDVAVLLQTVCDEFADSGSDVKYEGPLHCAVSARPLALERALNNLIDNSVKFASTVTATLNLTPSEIVIAIEDDGPGISDVEKEAVFKPFFRGDLARNDQRGGTGLGLSIVRSIVESHNGRTDLSDRLPQGLCVRLYLPRQKQDDIAASEAPPTPKGAAVAQGPRVR